MEKKLGAPSPLVLAQNALAFLSRVKRDIDISGDVKSLEKAVKTGKKEDLINLDLSECLNKTKTLVAANNLKGDVKYDL